jgi:hypothetical protein
MPAGCCLLARGWLTDARMSRENVRRANGLNCHAWAVMWRHGGAATNKTTSARMLVTRAVTARSTLHVPLPACELKVRLFMGAVLNLWSQPPIAQRGQQPTRQQERALDPRDWSRMQACAGVSTPDTAPTDKGSLWAVYILACRTFAIHGPWCHALPHTDRERKGATSAWANSQNDSCLEKGSLEHPRRGTNDAGASVSVGK